MKVLAIVAHPDDEVLGVGGTLAKHAEQGDEVDVLFLCESTSVRDGPSGMKKLKECANSASKILGISSLYFEDFPNLKTNSLSTDKFVNTVRKYLLTLKPEIIYTHHRGDVHLDHKKVFLATMNSIATVEMRFNKILCFHTPSSTEWEPPFLDYSFLPNEFVDISKTMDKKLKALEVYSRELREYPHPRSIKAIKLYSTELGLNSGLGKYTEGFEVIRNLR